MSASNRTQAYIELLEELRRTLSSRTTPPTGDTQPKADGSDQQSEKPFSFDWVAKPLSDEELSDSVLWYSDEHYSFYVDDQNRLYVAPVHINSLTPFEEQLEQRIHEAICEAGFLNDDLNVLVQELADALAKRMFACGMTGFTNHEYQLLQRACEVRDGRSEG